MLNDLQEVVSGAEQWEKINKHFDTGGNGGNRSYIPSLSHSHHGEGGRSLQGYVKSTPFEDYLGSLRQVCERNFGHEVFALALCGP